MNDALRYAGFWRRVLVHLIDAVIYLPVALAALYGIYGPEYFLEGGDEPFSYFGAWDLVINDLIPLLLVVWLWHRYGGTPGKRLLHLKVVDARTGAHLRWGQAVLRYFGYIASLLPLGLGFLWVIWDKRKQGFHDKLAGTVVIYAPEDESQKSLEALMKEGQ